jgi:hypothetical protein
MQHYPPKSSLSEERLARVAITGTGAADPTKRFGQGVAVARQGVGIHRLTFSVKPGKFVGLAGPVFRADTPSAVKGYTLTASGWTDNTTGGGYVDVYLWDASNNAVELAALQYLELSVLFTESGAAS